MLKIIFEAKIYKYTRISDTTQLFFNMAMCRVARWSVFYRPGWYFTANL